MQAYEKEFAKAQMECYGEEKQKELACKRRELSKAKSRVREIDALVQKLYEDNARGKISDERYATLSIAYEEEQRTLKADIPEMEAGLTAETDKVEGLERFIEKVKQMTQPTLLNAELVHEFIEKIVVFAPKYIDGKRVQLLDIYWNGIGIIRGQSPKEMEAVFEEHIRNQANTTKTA